MSSLAVFEAAITVTSTRIW